MGLLDNHLFLASVYRPQTFEPGGVRATTAMHYFHTFPTWQKTLVVQANFQGMFVFFFL